MKRMFVGLGLFVFMASLTSKAATVPKAEGELSE